eukprot:g4511.t1
MMRQRQRRRKKGGSRPTVVDSDSECSEYEEDEDLSVTARESYRDACKAVEGASTAERFTKKDRVTGNFRNDIDTAFGYLCLSEAKFVSIGGFTLWLSGQGFEMVGDMHKAARFAYLYSLRPASSLSYLDYNCFIEAVARFALSLNMSDDGSLQQFHVRRTTLPFWRARLAVTPGGVGPLKAEVGAEVETEAMRFTDFCLRLRSRQNHQ